MGWLDDPKVRAVRKSVARSLRRSTYQFKNVGPVIFLCGGERSLPRDNLNEYLARFQPQCHVFYAEHAWDVIARTQPEANALEVEKQLASLSDMVIVIVESPGTFAELGAFASSTELRYKLLPILEARYSKDLSFIRTGPVHWVDRDSLFRPSIWLPQERILEFTDQVESRIELIPPDKTRRVSDLLTSRKHLLFFVCDLVGVFGPCSQLDMEGLVEEVIDAPSVDVALYLGLGKAMEILGSFMYDGREQFFRPLKDGYLPSFHRIKKNLDIPTLRAQMVGAMQRSKQGLELLAAANEVWNAPH